MVIARIRRTLPVLIFAASLVLFGVRAFGFISVSNFINILRVVTFIAVPAIGLAVVMLSGTFDLSFVGVIGISAVVMISLTNGGTHPAVSLAVTLVLAVVLELINAVFIVRLHIHPWLTTIATMLVYLGVEKAISGGHYYTAEAEFFNGIRFGRIWGMPIAVWIMLVTWLVVSVVMGHTRIGKYLYAVGGSETAARKAGIDSDAYHFAAFAIMGAMSWVASIMYVGQLSGYPPEAAYVSQLEVILAVFFGMALSAKGVITVNGAFLGAAFVAFLANGMGLLGISSYWIKLLQGLLVVIVIIGNSISQGRLVRLD
ncbi:MAG: ABC transporter permease [Spirochaetales bacterium]|nr:ABC transporter permease [Spirochaetales bacterium]